MGWRAVVSENGNVTGYRETNTGERISVQEFERRHMMTGQGTETHAGSGAYTPSHAITAPAVQTPGRLTIDQPRHLGSSPLTQEGAVATPVVPQQMPNNSQQMPANIQQMPTNIQQMPINAQPMPESAYPSQQDQPMPYAGAPTGKNLRMATEPNNDSMAAHRGYVKQPKGFLDMTSISLVLPSLGMLIVFIIIVTTRVKRIRMKRRAEKEFAEKQGREV